MLAYLPPYEKRKKEKKRTHLQSIIKIIGEQPL